MVVEAGDLLPVQIYRIALKICAVLLSLRLRFGFGSFNDRRRFFILTLYFKGRSLSARVLITNLKSLLRIMHRALEDPETTQQGLKGG